MSRPDRAFEPFLEKMASTDMPGVAIDSFRRYYEQLRRGRTGLIGEEDIAPLRTLPDIEALPADRLTAAGRKTLPRTIMIKLNGGLGTSMGMERAKSLLAVKGPLSFLDIIVRQARRLADDPPLLFMNSFATREDTLAALKPYSDLSARKLPLDFLQHQVPKIDAETLGPVEWPANPELEWCPPGHGDLFPALTTSGMLNELLENGYEYAFVSNSDNLGAVPDPLLLGYCIENGLQFLMEVADRTEGDRKGGHLARMTSGRYVLREMAQCPDGDREAFQDIARHRYFNTNNVWVHLPSLKRIMAIRRGFLGLPMIRNTKTVDPRDPQSPRVHQLETAMGAAVAVFDRAGAIRVPRTRFVPVKDTNHLLAVRSDAYILNDRFQLVPNPQRDHKPPHIDLDPGYHRLIDDFETRFPNGAPSLVNCVALTVNGDVRFGSGVTLEGRIRLNNRRGHPVAIMDESRIHGSEGDLPDHLLRAPGGTPRTRPGYR